MKLSLAANSPGENFPVSPQVVVVQVCCSFTCRIIEVANRIDVVCKDMLNNWPSQLTLTGASRRFVLSTQQRSLISFEEDGKTG